MRKECRGTVEWVFLDAPFTVAHHAFDMTGEWEDAIRASPSRQHAATILPIQPGPEYGNSLTCAPLLARAVVVRLFAEAPRDE